MILVTKNFRFQNGQPARDRPVDIYVRDTTTREPIFNDFLGLVPLPNPIRTDDIGNVDFYIDEGSYDFFAEGVRVPFDAISPSGGGGLEPFVHPQISPASTWIIEHNLGFSKDPTILVDSRPNVSVITDIEHGDLNHTTISFPSPETGKAFF